MMNSLRPVFHWKEKSSIMCRHFQLDIQKNSEYVCIIKKHNYKQNVRIRTQHLGPNLRHQFKTPILFIKGFMQWLYDENDKKYLDMYGGIVTVSVGHCHPKVTAALQEQSKKLWHAPAIYMHPKIHEYAEKLTAKMPGNLKTVYYVNSGSEANDLAMFLARLHTKNSEIITLRNAYHGGSPYTMGLVAQSVWKYPVAGISSGIHHIMNPNPYTGLWGGKYCRNSLSQTKRHCNCSLTDNCEATIKYFQQFQELFQHSIAAGNCAAMFAESIQGVGGVVQFTKGYIKMAAELVRKNGGLFVSDEVQTGFGRTGTHFWGFEDHEIIPDIVTMAKGIGNGFPLAALVTTPEIAQCLSQAMMFNTFGGNPLACAVGLSVLEVIEEEKLQENARICGDYCLNGLENLQKIHGHIIGDVRGKGLMIGIELVSNRESRTPIAKLQMQNILEECRNDGVIFGTGGLFGNIIRIKPPMCITTVDIDIALDVLDKALTIHGKL